MENTRPTRVKLISENKLMKNHTLFPVEPVSMTGHSSLGMFQKYSHTGLDSKQRAIQALSSHILTACRNINQVVGQ